MYACFLQHLSRKVSVIQRLEDAKKGFSLFLINELMLRELRKKRILIHALKIFLRNMHGRLIQKLINDQHFKFTTIGIRAQVINAALQVIDVVLQLIIPVRYVHEGRLLSR